MILSREEVDHVAKLARLRLSEKEKDKYSKELSSILGYVEKLQQVDTKNVEPTSQVTGLVNVMREDVVLESGIGPELVDCAPVHGDGFVKIPRIFENK